MNPFASVGTGMAIGLSYSSRSESASARMAREFLAIVEDEQKAWRAAGAAHPADASADEIIARLRANHTPVHRRRGSKK